MNRQSSAGRYWSLPGEAFGLACIVLALDCVGAYALRQMRLRRRRMGSITRLEKSPWLLMPMFLSNPKLGTSFGALAGYMHYFDEESRPSIFAAMGQYTSTESIVSGIQTRTSFDDDPQRVIARDDVWLRQE